MDLLNDKDYWLGLTFRECILWLESNNCLGVLQEYNWITPTDENWHMKDFREGYNKELQERYPKRKLSLILKRVDCDDLLCATINDEKSNSIPVAMIHDFASEGWEGKSQWASIQDWYLDTDAWQW